MGIPAILQSLLFQGQSQGLPLPAGAPALPLGLENLIGLGAGGQQQPPMPSTQGVGAQVPGLPTAGVSQAGSMSGNPMDDSRIRDAQNVLSNLLGQHQQVSQMPGPVHPAYRTDDAIKMILGGLASVALGKNQGLESFLGNYAGAKQGLADQKTQLNNQQWQLQNQTDQQNRNADINAAQQTLSNENANYNRAYQSQVHQDQLKAQQDQRDQQTYNQLLTRYAGAKDRGTMEKIAPVLSQLGKRLGYAMPDISQADIEQDWQARSHQAINEIEDNWRSTVDKAIGRFGAIDDPQTIKYIEGERARLQKELRQYNPDLELSPAPTEKSLTERIKTETLQLAKDKYGLQKDMQVERIAAMKANIERQKERIAIAQTNAARGEFAANTGRMQYELGKARFDFTKALKGQLGTNDPNAKKKTGLYAKQADLQARIEGLNKAGQSEKAALVKTQLQGVNAQIKFYEDQMKDESQESYVGAGSVSQGSTYGTDMLKTKSGKSFSFVH